ncbi:hypothetical protein ACFSSA_07435 [Luteolibacter algae]|uniref:Uncharacterized protein n=1 Tax=Luteolibacter algae TaxID=454151 RepID=A0ABW5D5Z2_9BACT
MKTLWFSLLAGLILNVSTTAQLTKPPLEGVPVEASSFGKDWRILLQIANRTFSYGNDEEKVTVSVQILKEYPDAAAAKSGYEADARRYGGPKEKTPLGDSGTDLELVTDTLQERYLVVGRFFMKISQKAGEKDFRNTFADAYRPVLEAL